jgi:hypothetical protein
VYIFHACLPACLEKPFPNGYNQAETSRLGKKKATTTKKQTPFAMLCNQKSCVMSVALVVLPVRPFQSRRMRPLLFTVVFYRVV